MHSVLILVVFLLAGCNSMTRSSMPSPSPANTVEPVPMKTPRNQSVPRELKLKLTLDAPTDLKVKQGDRVRKGQVISDRTSARKQLEQQRQAIRLKLEHLNTGSIAPVNYAVEQAKVRQAQSRVKQAREAIAQFKSNSPWTNYAWVNLPLYKESAQVSQLTTRVQDAEAELDLTEAQLQVAREKEPVSTGGRDSFQQVLLMSQLKDIEAKLGNVGVVRSPYNGTIKKIKWSSQINQELTVECSLAVQG
jgi:multidrug efflux pump subunit AcrA (membrane-fusion protein)